MGCFCPLPKPPEVDYRLGVAVIFHIDIDSFFVSAERLRQPRLRGKCMAVGGRGARAVISSASYEARKFGVRSAMPSAQALRLCPGLILCPPDIGYYSAESKKVFAVVEEFAPVFEAVSIDEAYLDMSGTVSLYGEPMEAAAKLRKAILDQTGYVVSVGIAPNRLVAKVATDACKPNGLLEIKAGQEAAFLAPHPVRHLPGIGPVTEEWLRGRGVFTVGELQRFSQETLERHLGKFGTYLHESAWGRGSTRFHEEAKTRSISREETFEKDVADREALLGTLWEMARDLGQDLRKEEVFARAVRLKLRYPGFITVTRSRVLKTPAQTDQGLYEALETLFLENWTSGTALRLLGAGCVLGEGSYQLGLFDQPPQAQVQREELDRLKDELQKRFGERALQTGRDLAANSRAPKK